MQVKIYRKSYLREKHEIEGKIEELEDVLKSYREEILALACVAPSPIKYCEGGEMQIHEFMPRTVSEILDELENTSNELYFFRCALEAIESYPEDIEFDD